MGKIYDHIDTNLENWIGKQKVFFVATAPLSESGHINCSPRDTASLRILDGRTVAWLDLTGSGAETIAHLRENRRIVIMFCAFTGPPKIVRLHGGGEAIFPYQAEFGSLQGWFPQKPGGRAIIRVRIDRISDSCGYGVPLMDFKAPRANLDRWIAAKDEAELAAYQQRHNSRSIDNLPGMVFEPTSEE